MAKSVDDRKQGRIAFLLGYEGVNYTTLLQSGFETVTIASTNGGL